MKDKIITISFILFIFSFSILHILIPDKEISTTERRKLSSFPTFQLSSEYITKVEKYLLDHFPLREEFRSIKANFNYNVISLLENNSIYLKDDYIFKSNYPTNTKSINNFIKKIDYLKSLLTENNNAYILIIPDKNYYLDSKDFLKIDYDYIYNEINKLDINKIDIRNIMTLEDYYQTDTHWRQEKLEKVINVISDEMNFESKVRTFNENVYDKFYGVYYSQSALKRNAEVLTYLTNDVIESASVKYLENTNLTTVYNKEKLDSFDSYEVYLDGASSFIEITNPLNKSNRELVIFRDSFGSSISPLLIEYYSKITIIDNRYINSENFLKYIEFNDQDVLFLYSTILINESGSLKG